ncbi:major facilitator superfamily domain-containing protein [Circinella umbellata]|nr:major facilitator superfamily domain-containing protein [Circinella umbellata]
MRKKYVNRSENEVIISISDSKPNRNNDAGDDQITSTPSVPLELSNKDKEQEQLVRKIDLHVIPLFCTFYFVDFLDRSNIGNATTAGLQTDLEMTGLKLSVTVSAFFITTISYFKYLPIRIILKRIGARWWLSFIMLVWGIIAFVRNFTGLLIIRLLLGAAESGFVPGIVYQMSQIYKPQELGIRIAVFLCMGALSVIVSGPIAYGATSFEGKQGLHEWQYIILIDGTPTVIVALLSFCLLFDDITEVGWLTEKQKESHEARIAVHIKNAEREPITMKTMRTVLYDIKTWIFGVIAMLSSINMTSIGVFSLVIIKGFEFSTLTTQLLTTTPSIVAGVVIVIYGVLVDKGNKRAIIATSGSIVIAVSFVMLLTIDNPWGCYTAIFIVAGGIGTQAPISLSWPTVNYHDLTIRAVGTAIISMMGNLGNVIASFLYTVPGDTNHGMVLRYNVDFASFYMMSYIDTSNIQL